MQRKFVLGRFKDTGNASIDTEHEILARLLGRLASALVTHRFESNDWSYGNLRNAMATITLFVDMHFNTEESMMLKAVYPHREQHIRGHNEVREQISEAMESLKGDMQEINLDWIEGLMCGYVPAVLVSKDDQEFVEFLNQSNT